LNRTLVITTKSWKALIESLKGNAKHGYNKLESLEQIDGYFTAVLCQETDASYLERLKIVTGDEEDVEYALEFLSLQPQPITLQLTPEDDRQGVVKPTEAVVTKIKRTTRSKK